MRGSGRTTAQIQSLPKGGYFFVHNSAFRRQIERNYLPRLNREDIRVFTLNDLVDYQIFSGLEISGFDIDHFARTLAVPNIVDGILFMKMRVRP